MTISAQVIADSISPEGIRLTTFQVNCHRFILPEVNTHRMFSRNWASSRAIPTKKLIEMVGTNPAMPVHWGKNQPGMQAHEELADLPKFEARVLWREAAAEAAIYAQKLASLGAHKQLVNRVLEPYLWVRGVITATDSANFYALRRHEDAQPEIKALADAMWSVQQASNPILLQPGEWHVPYHEDGTWFPDGDRDGEVCDRFGHTLEEALKNSVASCGRVSYLTHDGRQASMEENIALCDRLLKRNPLHASPAEHQATPDIRTTLQNDSYYVWDHPQQHGNLKGWRQYRKTLANEYVAG